MGSIVGGLFTAVGSVVGAKKGISAADKAKDQQKAAATKQLDLSREIFETTEANAEPFIGGGSLALDALLFELGLGDAPLVGGETRFRVGSSEFDTREQAEDFARARPGVPVPFQQLPITRSKEGDFISDRPFQDRGVHQTLGTPARPVEEFTTGGTPFAGFQESPGFKFAFQKGVDAVDASAAAGGGLFSGSTLEDLTRFGQGFASQERGTFLDRLNSLVSVGQTGVGQVAGAGTVLNSFGGDAIAAFGNAQSAGTIAKNNAFQKGLSGVTEGLGQAVGGILSF